MGAHAVGELVFHSTGNLNFTIFPIILFNYFNIYSLSLFLLQDLKRPRISTSFYGFSAIEETEFERSASFGFLKI